MIKCWGETAITDSVDHSPVLLVSIRVAHNGIQDEVANKDVPSAVIPLRVGRGPDPSERAPHRFDGVPLATARNHRIGQELVAINQFFLTMRLVISGRDQYGLADHAVNRMLADTRNGELRSSRGETETLSNPAGNAL